MTTRIALASLVCAGLLPLVAVGADKKPEIRFKKTQLDAKFRSEGVNITSSWIDEDGAGQTGDWEELWERIAAEISDSAVLVLYAESGDFPLKGALVEIGIALGLGLPVIVCLPGVVLTQSFRPVGSWINHPLVCRVDDIGRAMELATTGG